MNVCRLVECEGDLGYRFWLLLTSQGVGVGGGVKQQPYLINTLICNVGVERVNDPDTEERRINDNQTSRPST